MPIDKLKQLYQALEQDGAVSQGEENFINYMLAPGDEGHQNRNNLYEALKADGAVSAPTYDEFMNRLGLTAEDTLGIQENEDVPTTPSGMVDTGQATEDTLMRNYGYGGAQVPTENANNIEGVNPSAIAKGAEAGAGIGGAYLGARAGGVYDLLGMQTQPTQQQPAQQQQPAPQQQQRPAADQEQQGYGGFMMPDTSQMGLNAPEKVSVTAPKAGISAAIRGIGSPVPVKNEGKYAASRWQDDVSMDYQLPAGAKVGVGDIVQGESIPYSTVFRNFVKSTVADAVKAADAAGSKAEEEFLRSHPEMFGKAGAGTSGGAIQAALAMMGEKAGNEKRDPEAIMRNIMNELPKYIIGNKPLMDFIFQAAASNNVSPGDFTRSIVPILLNDIRKELYGQLVERQLPTSTVDWIADGAMDSAFGKLYEALTNTKGGQEVKNFAREMTASGMNPYYEPSAYADAGRFGFSLLAQAPEFLGFGGAGAAASMRIFGREALGLMAKGYTKAEAMAAMQISRASQGLGKRLLFGVGEGVTSGAVTLTGVNALEELARQIRDKDGISISSIGKQALHGAETGALFGVVGGSIGASTAKLSGWKKFMANVFGFEAEAAVLAGMSLKEKIDAGQTYDLLELLGEGNLQTLVMKIATPHFYSNIQKFINTKGPEFSDQTLKELNEVMDLSELAANYVRGMNKLREKQKAAKAKAGGKEGQVVQLPEPEMSPEVAKARKEIEEKLMAGLTNPNLTYKTRNAVSIALGKGPLPEPPTAMVGEMEQNGSIWSVPTMDMQGRVLERRAFKDKEKAQAYLDEQIEIAEHNRVNQVAARYYGASLIADSRVLSSRGLDMDAVEAAAKKPAKDRTAEEKELLEKSKAIRIARKKYPWERTYEEDDLVEDWERAMAEELSTLTTPDNVEIVRESTRTTDEGGLVINTGRVVIKDKNGQVIFRSHIMGETNAEDFRSSVLDRQDEAITNGAVDVVNRLVVGSNFGSLLMRDIKGGAREKVARYEELEKKSKEGALTEDEQKEFDRLAKDYKHNLAVTKVFDGQENVKVINEKLDNGQDLNDDEKAFAKDNKDLYDYYLNEEGLTDETIKAYEDQAGTSGVKEAMQKLLSERSDVERQKVEDFREWMGVYTKVMKTPMQHAWRAGWRADARMRTAYSQQFAEVEAELRKALGYEEGDDIAANLGLEKGNEDLVKTRIMRGSNTPEEKDLAIRWIDLRATMQGVRDHVADEINAKVAKAREEALKLKDNDGMVRRVQIAGDEPDTQIDGYVKDGTVVLRPDGTVDKERSSKMIYVQVPGEDKPRPLAPEAILGMDMQTDARIFAEDAAMEAQREAEAAAYAPVEPAPEARQEGEQGGEGTPQTNIVDEYLASTGGRMKVYNYGTPNLLNDGRNRGDIMRVAKRMLQIFNTAKDFDDFHQKMYAANMGTDAADMGTLKKIFEAYRRGEVTEQDIESLFGVPKPAGPTGPVVEGNRKLTIGDQDYEVQVLGENDGKVMLMDASNGEQFEMPKENFEASQKAYADKVAAAQKAAELEDKRKTGIVGYSEGTPDISHPDNNIQTVLEYLKETSDPKKVTRQAEDFISAMDESIPEREKELQQQLDWMKANGKEYLEQYGQEGMDKKKAEISTLQRQLAEQKARRDHWEQIRVGMMTAEERKKMKDERTALQKTVEEEVRQNAEAYTIPEEMMAIDRDSVLDTYDTQNEAKSAMAKEWRNHDNRVAAIDERIKGIDNTLRRWKDGEYHTEDEVRSLIAERAQLVNERSARQARQTEIAKQKNKLPGWYRKREEAGYTPSELAYVRLEKETDMANIFKRAHAAIDADADVAGADKGLLHMIIDNDVPENVEEYVASNLGYGSLAWEDSGEGMSKKRGVNSELFGGKGSRSFTNGDARGFNAYLAKKGQGKSVDQVAHELWEESPKGSDGEHLWDSMDIKNAILGLLQGAERPTDISRLLFKNRINEMLRLRREILQRYEDEEREGRRQYEIELLNRYETETDEVDGRGGLVKNEAAERLPEFWRGALHGLGRHIGRRVEIVSEEYLREIYGDDAEKIGGFNDPNTNTVYLNEAIIGDDETMRAFTTGHEFTHVLQDEMEASDAIGIWDAYIDAVKNAMGEEAFNAEYKRIEKQYKDAFDRMNEKLPEGKKLRYLKKEEIEEEIGSNWAGDHVLSDREAVQDIIKRAESAGADPAKLAQRVLNWINGKIATLKEALGIGENVEKELSDMEKAKALWQEMYDIATAKQNERFKEDSQRDATNEGEPVIGDDQLPFSLSADAGERRAGQMNDEQKAIVEDMGGVHSVTQAAQVRDVKFNIITEPELEKKLMSYARTKDARNKGWTKEKMEEIVEETRDLINAIHEGLSGNWHYDEFAKKNPTMAVDWRDGEMHYTVTWSRNNIEYKYDMSADLLCVNNDAMESVLGHPKMVAIIKQIAENNPDPKVGYSSNEYLRLYDIMDDMGFVVQCKGCFDAAGRFKMLPSVAQKFANEVNTIIDERNTDPAAFDKGIRELEKKRKAANGMPVTYNDREEAVRVAVAAENITEHINFTDLLTAEGQTKMLEQYGGLFRAWQRTGAGRPKDKLLAEPYIGDIVDRTGTIIAPYRAKTPSYRDIMVNVGTGLRRNSHSEMRPYLTIDEIQMMRDAYVRELCVFKYMKELDDVRLFGNLGVKYNISFFPAYDRKGTAAGLDANGEYIASEESVGAREFPYKGEDGKTHYDGMKGWHEAEKYRNDDVSLSSVIFSLPHLIKALTDVPTPKDPRGRWGSLIPFHASGATPEQIAMQKLGRMRASDAAPGGAHPFEEAFSDWDKGVTNFEQVQNDRFGEGWAIVEGKKAGTNVEPGHKLEFVNGTHYYNPDVEIDGKKGIHLFAKGWMTDEDYQAYGKPVRGKKHPGLHSFEVDYNEKVRELGTPYAYKEAADYYLDELPRIGLVPRFEFSVPEEVFLEACKAGNVDPHDPKLGWKGEGHDWNPIDSDAYYSMFCDYGMTKADGTLSPHRPVGYIDENGNRSFRLPDNAAEIARRGADLYTNRRTTEDKMVDEAIRRYTESAVEDGKLTREQADAILGSDQQQQQFSLGVPYQGSKNRIAEKIVEKLPKGNRFVDLFSGGGAVTHAAMLSGKYGGYRMNDLDGVAQELFLQGVRGDWRDYNRTSMTPEEFAQIKGTPEALPWSFNSLGRNVVRNDTNGAVQSRIRRIKALEELSGQADRIEASRDDYRNVTLQPGDVVYCDIPYEMTDQRGYRKGNGFNKQEFVEWAQKQDAPVYVSEYTMPEGWTEIASFEVPGMRGGKRVEKLWVQDRFADGSDIRETAKVENEEGGQISFSIREKKPPKKVLPCYKLVRLGKDGKAYPLYIDAATPMEMGTWYDADSPDLSMLQGLPSGVHLVDQKTKETMSYDDFYKEHTDLFPKGKTKYPSKEAVNWATDKGMRFMFIEDTKTGQRRFGGENRRYWNLGINGSGTVSTFSMRPGWHAASLPSMRQIGKGAKRDLRDDSFVWVLGEISADVDYNEEARQNPDNDLPDRIPVDGYYMKATNADAAKSQADRIGWYVSGAFKPVRFISDSEARATIDEWNKDHPDAPVEYDYERESGMMFNAKTMQLESQGNQVMFSIQDEIKRAEEETETNLSDAQKKAGNYKKGHVKIDGFDFTIEQPKGSVRSGVDESGKAWSTKMNNTYGYIRGTEGADGDHVDVFLSDHMDDWNGMVFVVDQIKKDGTFDEHKVMYGFNDYDEAWNAYHSNYEKGWKGLGDMNGITLDGFKKWLDSSDRKAKEFSDFAYPRMLMEKELKDSKGNIIDREKSITSHKEAVNIINAVQTEAIKEFSAKPTHIISERSDIDIFEKAGAYKKYVDILRKIYDEPKTLAYYSHLLDEVFVFPNKIVNFGLNAHEVKAAIYHENTHHVLFHYFSDKEVAHTAALIEKYYPRIKKSVEERYKDKVDERTYNEELVCALIEMEVDNGNYGFLNNLSHFKTKDLTRNVDKIAEYLKGKEHEREETRLRSSRLDGGTGKTLDETTSTSSRGKGAPDTRRGEILGGSPGTRQTDEGEGRNVISFSLSPKVAKTYDEAVEKGDNGTAAKMVKEAAKAAMPETKVVDENGDPMVVYHDTNSTIYINKETGENWDDLDWRKKDEWNERDDWDEHWEEQDFYEFDNTKHGRQSIEIPGFFFSPTPDPYHEYGKRRVAAYLDIKNPIIDPEIPNRGVTDTAGRDAMEEWIRQGYDGMIRTDEDGNWREVVAFHPNQIKSADPITRDKDGNIIPLSERFNPERKDIRFSLSPEKKERRGVGDHVDKWNARGVNEYNIETVGDAAKFVYDMVGLEKGAHAYSTGFDARGVDLSRLLDKDDSNGRKVDTKRAKEYVGHIEQMVNSMKKSLEEAIWYTDSEAAKRYLQGVMDDCDRTLDWYRRAAQGDVTIFDEEKPRMFRISRDGKGLDKKTVAGNWTEDEVREMERKLGGSAVTIETEETIPEDVRRRLLLGEDIRGWYDESDGSVHLYAPAIESVDDARYTICHEKLGHEGLRALLGSDQAVTDWGNFMYLSAGRDLRAQMDEIAEGSFSGDPFARSKAAQELFAEIAEEGPRTADEFSLWRKVKHFLIKQAQKRGWNVRGLLNDADMRYYVLKTGEALKRYEGMPDDARRSLEAPGLMFAGSGKPRRRRDESMQQFLSRLERWEREQQRIRDMEAAGAQAPEKDDFEQRWHQQWEADDAAWKERHGLEGDEPQRMPQREEGESDESLMGRIKEYERWTDAMRDQDDKRPNEWEYAHKAHLEWQDAMRDFEREWGLEDEDHAALNLFDPPMDGERPVGDGTLEGDLSAIGERLQHVDASGAPITAEDAAAEHAALQELGDALGADMSAEGARRHVKISVIERRKELEGRSAEDSVFIHHLGDRINEVAEQMTAGGRSDRKAMADRIKKVLPFIIEIPRRQKEIADDLNGSLVWQYGRLVTLSGEDIAAVEERLAELRESIATTGIDSEQTKRIAMEVADELNYRHQGDFFGGERQMEVSEGALNHLADQMTNSEAAHRGGKPIPPTTPDELREWVDDLETMRNLLQKISQAGNVENLNQVREQLLDSLNAMADRYVNAFNERHMAEIESGNFRNYRRMTRGDLLDILWATRGGLKVDVTPLGVQPLTGSDLMAVASIATKRLVPEGMEVDRSLLQPLVDDIGDWYRNWYVDIEAAGLKPSSVGKIEHYVNHRWNYEKGIGRQIDENFQRTRSANMRNREIPTLMTGLEIGMEPVTTDITELMSYYSRHNAEAVANRGLIDALAGVMVEETNSKGEPLASVPLLTTDEPRIAPDRYELYQIPGMGTVWVHDYARTRFANVFGPIGKAGEKDTERRVWNFFDTTASTMKKINLSFSGFHAGALTEVYIAQAVPQFGHRAISHFYKYLIGDCLKKGTLPAYANPETFKDAARHLVKLGATDDYAASNVNLLTEQFKKMLEDARDRLGDTVGDKASKAMMSPHLLVATMLDWANKGMDKFLWDFLHDGLKMAAYDLYAGDIRKRAVKEGWDEAKTDKMLDEAGQYVNDMFGGQYWELINVSPSTLKFLQRILLSPDWLLSTNRHFFGNFGFGSLYSEKKFLDYLTQDWGGAKRAIPASVRRWLNIEAPEKDGYRAFRSKNSKICYIIGVLGVYHVMMNALNALMRKKDMEEQQRIAEERRAAGEDYRSPYELIYGDDLENMQWYDYLMWGNTMEKQSNLFGGRYKDGTEMYVRWGKQFREFPELFMNEKGNVEFPFPLINRMMGKSNPVVRTLFDTFIYSDPHKATYWDKKMQEEYGKELGLVYKVGKNFLPFGMPTEDKEYTKIDFVFPTTKGFSNYKAKNYFKEYIKVGDMEGVEMTYNACVQNGLDAKALLDAVIKDLKTDQRYQMSDGITSQQDAMDRFDSSNSLIERRAMKRKIEDFQLKEKASQFRQDEAVEQATKFISGEDKSTGKEKPDDVYIQQASSTDIKEDAAMNWIYKECDKRRKEAKRLREEGTEAEAGRYALTNMKWLSAYSDLNDAVKDIRKLKKEMKEAADEGNYAEVRQILAEIRATRKEVMDNMRALMQKTIPFDELQRFKDEYEPED